MERLTKKLGPHPFSLLFTGLFAALFGALLVYLCIVLGRDRAAVGLNLLVALLVIAGACVNSPTDSSSASASALVPDDSISMWSDRHAAQTGEVRPINE